MEGRGIGGAVGSQLIELAVHQPIASGVVLLLVDDCQHSGEDGGGEARATGSRKELACGIAKAAGATTLLPILYVPRTLIAGAIQIARVVNRGVESHIRNIAFTIRRN